MSLKNESTLWGVGACMHGNWSWARQMGVFYVTGLKNNGLPLTSFSQL